MGVECVVTDVCLHSREGLRAKWLIALDRSPFVPAAAGTLTARNSSGAVLVAEVASVERAADGILWHVTNKPLPVGTQVDCEVFGEDKAG